ncbi:MAG: hypothetical protein WAL75_25070 [Terracidiphilus sp.]
MAVDRRSDIHCNGCGEAADSGIPGVFGCLVHFLKRAAENQVHGSLRDGGGMNDEAVLIGVKLSHLSNYRDIFSTIETRKEFDSHQDIVVQKDFEASRHWGFADRELPEVWRTDPQSNVLRASEYGRLDVDGLERINPVPFNRVAKRAFCNKASKNVWVEVRWAHFANANSFRQVLPFLDKNKLIFRNALDSIRCDPSAKDCGMLENGQLDNLQRIFKRHLAGGFDAVSNHGEGIQFVRAFLVSCAVAHLRTSGTPHTPEHILFDLRGLSTAVLATCIAQRNTPI